MDCTIRERAVAAVLRASYMAAVTFDCSTI